MKKVMLLFLSLYSIYGTLSAQKVEGIVTDNSNEPLIGVVVVADSQNSSGTITDANGKYSLQVSDRANSILEFRYMGYTTQRIPVKNQTVIDVTMQEESTELGEVVVVGYGTMRKSDLTGAVSSIKIDDREAAQVSSFDKLLQGKVAGMSVVSGSAAPGGAVNIRIRGASSLRGSNEPLYVIDGNIIEVDQVKNSMSQGVNAGNAGQEEQNPLSSINPADIESIEVLKDASATAIYGSQGANGVILITTKRGVSETPVVQFNASLDIASSRKKIDMLDGYEYTQFINEAVLPGNPPVFGTDTIRPINWQDDILLDNAISQSYRLSVRGKKNKMNYYLAGGWTQNRGIVKRTGVDQGDFRINFETQLSDRVKIASRTSLVYVTNSMTQGTESLGQVNSSMIRQIISKAPLLNIPFDYDAGDAALDGPRVWLSDYDDDSREYRVNSVLNADIRLVDWLTYKLNLGVDYRDKKRERWYGKALWIGSQANGKAGMSELSSFRYNVENLLQFQHKFNRYNRIDGIVGLVYNQTNVKNGAITGEDFFTESLRAKGVSMASVIFPYDYSETESSLFSLLGRVIYSYRDRYVLTATFRSDTSSKYAKGMKTGYFPSFAFAWRINEESFLRDKFSNLSNLKLRVGWGQVGNQAIPAYQSLNVYNRNRYTSPNGNVEIGVSPVIPGNPGLTWETSEQYNAGIDFGLWNNRLLMTVDIYNKYTRDLLQQIETPPSFGYSRMWINRGEIQNKGLEISVEGIPVETNKFSWVVGANIAFNKSKVLDLGLPPSDFGTLKSVVAYLGNNVTSSPDLKAPANIFMEGKPIGIFYGYKTNGIMQQAEYDSQDPANKLKYNGVEILAGDVKFVDQDGDYNVTSKDLTIIGDPNPDFIYSFNTSFMYRNFTLSAFFNGSYGNDIVNANLVWEENVSLNTNNNIRREAYRNAWRSDAESNEYPRLRYASNSILMDRYVEDGSFLRLSTLTLAYQVPVKKIGFFKSLSFNVTGKNLFVLTSYRGYDPEVNSFTYDGTRMGIDLNSYPAVRSFLFGLSATF